MSRRPAFVLALALIQASLVCTAGAQTLYFSDGRTVPLSDARIKGSNIIISLKIEGAPAESANLTLPISSLSRIDWATPSAIAEAEADLNADKPAEALKKIDAIINEQEALREIPGSWWSKAAVVKAIALARMGKDIDADVMIERMRRAKADPGDISRVDLAVITELIAAGKIDQANARIAKLPDTANDENSQASLAIIKARIAENVAERQQSASSDELRVEG